MKQILKIIMVMLLLLLGACSQETSRPYSDEEVKEIVQSKLDSRFNYDFKITKVSYDQLSHVYTVSAKVDTPQLTFSFDFPESKLSNNGEGLKRIYGTVVYTQYQRQFDTEIQQLSKRTLPDLKLVESNFLLSSHIHLEEEKYKEVPFRDFAEDHGDENYYDFYFVTEADFDDSYFQNNLRDFLIQLKKNHYEKVRLVVVFRNNIHVDTGREEIDALLSKPLEKAFQVKENENPMIPGFDHAKWRESLE
jgi:hypothetical protein